MEVKSGDYSICGHCGHTGYNYGIGLARGVSAPWCWGCGKNDKLAKIKEPVDRNFIILYFNDKPIKFFKDYLVLGKWCHEKLVKGKTEEYSAVKTSNWWERVYYRILFVFKRELLIERIIEISLTKIIENEKHDKSGND